MQIQPYANRSGHPAKSAFTAIFLILSTIAFILTVLVGVAMASLIFNEHPEESGLAVGISLALLIIYFFLTAITTAVFAVVDIILGAVLMKCSRGKAHGLGKAAVVLNVAYILLASVYALLIYFV